LTQALNSPIQDIATEEAHVASLNDQVREHERAIEANSITIASLQHQIISLREENRIRRNEQRRLRARRRVFEAAVFRLKQIDLP